MRFQSYLELTWRDQISTLLMPSRTISFMFWIASGKLWNWQRASKRQFVVNLLGKYFAIFPEYSKVSAENWILQNWHWSLWKRFGILGREWAIQVLWERHSGEKLDPTIVWRPGGMDDSYASPNIPNIQYSNIQPNKYSSKKFQTVESHLSQLL